MDLLNYLQDSVITNLKQIIEFAEKNNLTNEQSFINFLDKVNELSVSH
jgi:hypothetical protein